MNILRVVIGLIVGFILGSSWGLLNAPEKGYKTRKKLEKKIRKLSKNWNG